MVSKQGSGAKSKSSSAPRKKRQWLSAEKRRDQIIESAQKVFVRLGLNGARTQDLAKEAGVNEATLFLYFKNKQEIFEASILEPLSELISGQLARSQAFSETIDDDLRDVIGETAHKEIYQYMEKVGPLLSTAILSGQKLGEEIYRSEIYPFIKKMSEAVSISFHLGDRHEDAEFVVIAALGLSFLMQTHYQLMGTTPDVDAITNRISHLFIHGVEHKV